MRSVPVGPENTWQVPVPLGTKGGCLLPQHCFDGSIESLYHPVALGMVGSRI